VLFRSNLNNLALLDNFCWCSSNEEERLGQLKESVKACYDLAIGYGTPFISGKDSMFNDFKGYDEEGNELKISVPPTLLVSSIGVIDDASRAVDLALKFPDDLIYLIGETREELGGSEYFAELGFIGNSVPKVDFKKAKKVYEKLSKAIEDGIIASAISIVQGGLGAAMAKTAIAGQLGLEINLSKANRGLRDDYFLFSESQSRLLVSVAPQNKAKFEKVMGGDACLIGKVRDDQKFIVKGLEGEEIINETIGDLEKAYKETLKDY